MTSSKVRVIFALSTSTVLFVAGVGFGVRFSASAAQPNDNDVRLRQLLRDRVSIRKDIVDRFEKLKGRGGSSMVEVLVATRDMLWAELDLYTTKAERINALERILEHEKKITAFFAKTPDFPEVERLLLRVRLLDAEITLMRERMK